MIDEATTLELAQGGQGAAGAERTSPSSAKPLRPLDAVERRVLGVLIEKGKTTPDQYPLSLNALVSGCNQKSNRDPVMTLDEERVSRALSRLRESGVTAEVFGNGRIARYRHLAYERLGVEKEELSILAELLLRGEQSEGDLRGRVARMDSIPDLVALRTHLDRLAARGLVVWLSPPGRGRLLTHGLLPPEELREVQSRLGTTVVAGGPTSAGSSDRSADAGMAPQPEGQSVSPGPRSPDGHGLAVLAQRVADLEKTIAELLERVATLEIEAGPGRGE